MNDVLLKYMESRFKVEAGIENLLSTANMQTHGPVITVSRETGCSGNQFVKELSLFLNSQEKRPKQILWQWVNKEIIYETANELQVHPSRVYKLFRGEPRKLMDEIADSLFIRYYKNDRIITKAVKEIVKKIASRGNVIILGRGGVGLTRHIRDSVHIRLYAPKQWRIEGTSRKLKISLKEANEFVERTDKERNMLIRKFALSENDNDLFDIGFNCMSNSYNDMFSGIVGVLRSKGIM